MALKNALYKNMGHPYNKRPGFDVLMMSADNDEALEEAINKAKAKFWKPWLTGYAADATLPAAMLYKPCGIDKDWNDSIPNPHPGIINEAVAEA